MKAGDPVWYLRSVGGRRWRRVAATVIRRTAQRVVVHIDADGTGRAVTVARSNVQPRDAHERERSDVQNGSRSIVEACSRVPAHGGTQNR